LLASQITRVLTLKKFEEAKEIETPKPKTNLESIVNMFMLKPRVKFDDFEGGAFRGMKQWRILFSFDNLLEFDMRALFNS
jgi:hypothetical protein